MLAVAPEDMDYVKNKFGPHLGLTGVSLVAGGKKRPHTVKNALEKVSKDVELVAVHDAARPCVMSDWIDKVFAAAASDGAAILAAQITDTLKKSDDGKRVAETFDRKGLWVAQTPQVFKRDLIIKAYEQTGLLDKVTDDAQLIEALGHPVRLVESAVTNIKVTWPGDVKVVEALLKAMPRPKPRGMLGPYEAEKMW
jgi:2-C-methyl-D-erythritol 4-phosphate cytidylyltransferase